MPVYFLDTCGHVGGLGLNNQMQENTEERMMCSAERKPTVYSL